jgi:cysteine-rich repeat protein
MRIEVGASALATVLGVIALGACGGTDGELGVDQLELVSTCGNGTREAGEQCDDGNVKNLDGCDSSCKFEQNQRMNTVGMQFSTDSFCTANAVGGAIGSQAQDRLAQALTDSVNTGDVSIMFKFMGLQDLSGTNAPAISIGSVLGKPVAGDGYNGASDLDWWYAADATSLDADRNPKGALSGKIAQKKISAGPGNLTLMLALAGAPAPFRLANVKVRGTVGGESKPTASSNAKTPGHVAGERLDPALKSFGSIGDGQMCANIVAASLASMPIPEELTSGSYACSQGYTTSNSILDLFVGGCRVFIVTAITGTQPDQVVGTAPAGGRYTLVTNSSKKVAGCKDGQGREVALNTCLSSAAYSIAFKFTSDRVIIK